MLSSRDLERIEGFLDGDARVLACVPATPDGAVPDTVGAVLARSFGSVPSARRSRRRWDPEEAAFFAEVPPVDLGSWRQVLVVHTASPDRLVVVGVDALRRPVAEVWSVALAAIADVTTEPIRLHGIATDALVVSVTGAGPLRFALARPHRRAGCDLADRLGAAARVARG